tara:strand:+ start:225 stop:428 length:204 start_codon:yes stop_codon:yes gene_type:complete
MKLSKQAMGSLMMALQKSLMEQSDITLSLEKMDFIPGVDEEGEEAELYVKNPPIVKLNDNLVEDEEA